MKEKPTHPESHNINHLDYLDRNEEILRKLYGGKWIIMLDDVVVAADKKAAKAATRARKVIGKAIPFMTYIETEKESKMPFIF